MPNGCLCVCCRQRPRLPVPPRAVHGRRRILPLRARGGRVEGGGGRVRRQRTPTRQQGKKKNAPTLDLSPRDPHPLQAKAFAKTTYRKVAYKTKEAVDKFETWSRRAK